MNCTFSNLKKEEEEEERRRGEREEEGRERGGGRGKKNLKQIHDTSGPQHFSYRLALRPKVLGLRKRQEPRKNKKQLALSQL